MDSDAAKFLRALAEGCRAHGVRRLEGYVDGGLPLHDFEVDLPSGTASAARDDGRVRVPTLEDG